MSDIRANLIRNSSGNGPINLSWPRASDGKIIGQSASKGYALFDAAFGTEDSFNLSSTVSSAQGLYAGTLTSAVSSANKAVYVCSPRNMGAGVFTAISRATGSTTNWNGRTRNKSGENIDYAWAYTLNGELA